MLVGNGLSIAFSDKLMLGNISSEVTDRLTSIYGHRSDDVAKAMQKVAAHARTGDPINDFESLIGAFGDQSDILRDLTTFADLTEDSPKISEMIKHVREFVGTVQRKGIGHTLEIIVEHSKPENGVFDTISNFLSLAIGAFSGQICVANINYDDLILTELSKDIYRSEFCDLGTGYGERILENLLDTPFRAFPLRTINDLPRRIRLLNLHGAVTFWQVGDDYLKIPLATARKTELWERYRNADIAAAPLIVLANQHDKADHVRLYPFNLAYEVAEDDFRDSDHWLIVGYSFRDTCVNDLLRRSWEVPRNRPKILIVTKGDNPTTNDVENAFGWESGKFSDHNAKIESNWD
jgi:hypothetical protein